MTSPAEPLPVLAVVELIDQARRLGLLQIYRPATVENQWYDPNATMVVGDGDDVPMRAISLIGAVPANARVMIMTVPPQGVYIIGYLGAAASLPDVQTFTATGRWSFFQGLRYARVQVWGGGGGGGGVAGAAAGQHTKGAGGGEGGYSESIILGALLSTSGEVVTIGAAGTAGASGGGNGGNGGTSSFGSLVIALGGSGGSFSASSATPFGAGAGAGAGVGTGQIALGGAPGQMGWGDTTLAISGGGGGSGGGVGRVTTGAAQSAAGAAAVGKAGGGGGAISSSTGAAAAGGAGAPGMVIVTSYY